MSTSIPIQNYTYSSNYDDASKFFLVINPYIWAYLGGSLAIALSVISAAWGIALTSTTILGCAVSTPRIRTKNIISVIFCEALAIYGIITAIILQLKVVKVTTPMFYASDYHAAYGLFWTGMLVGWSNIGCGIAVGVSGSSAAIADAASGDLFIKVLVVEIFASALGLFGLIVGIVQQTSAIFNHQIGPLPF